MVEDNDLQNEKNYFLFNTKNNSFMTASSVRSGSMAIFFMIISPAGNKILEMEEVFME